MLIVLITAVLGEIVRRLIMSSAARARARRLAGSTVFRITIAGRAIFLAAIAILGGLTIVLLTQGDDWRVALLLAPFFFLCLLGYPGCIVIDPAAGVTTCRWYGRPTEIRWYDVKQLIGPDQLGQSILMSAGGQKIVHTSFHVDGAAFRREVERHAHVTATPRV